jgi:hypothetical protein
LPCRNLSGLFSKITFMTCPILSNSFRE